MSESHSRVTIATVTLENGRPALLLFLLSLAHIYAPFAPLYITHVCVCVYMSWVGRVGWQEAVAMGRAARRSTRRGTVARERVAAWRGKRHAGGESGRGANVDADSRREGRVRGWQAGKQARRRTGGRVTRGKVERATVV